MESRGRGVLDTPHAAGRTALVRLRRTSSLRGAKATKQSRVLAWLWIASLTLAMTVSEHPLHRQPQRHRAGVLRLRGRFPRGIASGLDVGAGGPESGGRGAG